MISGGSKGSSVATVNFGLGSGSSVPSASALPPAGRRSSASRYRRVATTGVVETPHGTHRITGKFRRQRLTPTSLHRIVRDTISGIDDVREHQNRSNLRRLAFLYECDRTNWLQVGDDPVRVHMWMSVGVGTIEDVEGHRFDLDGPTDLAPVTMMIQRIENGILAVEAVNLSALRAYEQRHGIEHSMGDWFERIAGRGIPETDDDEMAIDPGKLRRVHNRSHLEGLYHTRLDPVMLKVDPGEKRILDTVDASRLRTIGEIPVGAWLEMWALVDIKNGHVAKIVYPEAEFDEMRFGIASFTVDMRDRNMLVVSWDRAQPDLVVKELNGAILQEFRKQDVIIYRPGKDSLRLDPEGSLRRPSQWLEDQLMIVEPRRDTQRPTTAVSDIGLDQHGHETTGVFAMEASGAAGPEGVDPWW